MVKATLSQKTKLQCFQTSNEEISYKTLENGFTDFDNKTSIPSDKFFFIGD